MYTISVFFARRDKNVHELEKLNEAQQPHAEKQVQELDGIDRQIATEIGLVGELARQRLVASNCRQIVGIRELEVFERSGECALVVLERTLVQAVVAYEVAGLERQVEEVVRTNGLID